MCTCAQVTECQVEYDTLMANVLKESGVAPSNALVQSLSDCMDEAMKLMENSGLVPNPNIPYCNLVIKQGYMVCQPKIIRIIRPFIDMMKILPNSLKYI